MDDALLADALASARLGNEAGFEALWRSLQPPVLRYVRVISGDAAEDVASEVWLQIARDIRDFRGDVTSFRVYLFRVARNRAIDESRRRARRHEDPFEQPPDTAGIDDSLTGAFEAMDTQWALRVIGSLPRDQAEVIMLRVVAGLDVAQTARVLGKRPGAVRVAAMRGLRRLAGLVEVMERRRVLAGSGAAEPM